MPLDCFAGIILRGTEYSFEANTIATISFAKKNNLIQQAKIFPVPPHIPFNIKKD